MNNFTKIMWFCIIVIFGWGLYMAHGQDRYAEGLSDGYSAALDTVSKIVENQYNTDTTVTKLVIINPDTCTYYLQRKTAIKE